MEVEEDGNKIIVQTGSGPSTKEIVVDVSRLTPRLADRFMARSYQKGYDKITVKYNDPETAIAIQNKVKELLGLR